MMPAMTSASPARRIWPRRENNSAGFCISSGRSEPRLDVMPSTMAKVSAMPTRSMARPNSVDPAPQPTPHSTMRASVAGLVAATASEKEGTVSRASSSGSTTRPLIE